MKDSQSTLPQANWSSEEDKKGHFADFFGVRCNGEAAMLDFFINVPPGELLPVGRIIMTIGNLKEMHAVMGEILENVEKNNHKT